MPTKIFIMHDENFEGQNAPKIVYKILGFCNLSYFSKISENFQRLSKDFLKFLRALRSLDCSQFFEIFRDFRDLARSLKILQDL